MEFIPGNENIDHKILFWINKEFLMFGIAKKITKKLNCKTYAIIDTNDYIKSFYEEQKTVDFDKTWFFNDFLSLEKLSPDYEYLKSFEKKYDIDLWYVISFERLFSSEFNKYYKFTKNEILSFVINECKLFEKILSEVKPTVIILPAVTRHFTYLLHKMATKLGIRSLLLEYTHFGDRNIITDEFGKMVDNKKYENLVSISNRNFEELQKYFSDYKPYVYGIKNNTIHKERKVSKVLALLKFLFNSDNKHKNHYSTYGKNKSSILIKGNARLSLLTRKLRSNFIDKNFLGDIPNKTNYVYFPLGSEPERASMMNAPFYTDQKSVITNIAKSLPIDYELYVKEHPYMREVNWREISYYKQIMNLPNVKLIHPSVSHNNLIENSALVISVSGTGGLEAAFFNKPSITFTDESGYSVLPSVYTIKSYSELPIAIKKSLKTQVNISDLNKYVDYFEKYSFYSEQIDFISELVKKFNMQIGYQNKINITPSEMNSFLDTYDSMFENLSNHFLLEINSPKTLK